MIPASRIRIILDWLLSLVFDTLGEAGGRRSGGNLWPLTYFNHLKLFNMMVPAVKNLLSRPFYLLPVLLLVPLTAMLFTAEVNWSALDFLVMGVLLFALGAGIELVRGTTKVPEVRVAWIFILLVVFFLIWAELAVGIFGTVFAGS